MPKRFTESRATAKRPMNSTGGTKPISPLASKALEGQSRKDQHHESRIDKTSTCWRSHNSTSVRHLSDLRLSDRWLYRALVASFGHVFSGQRHPVSASRKPKTGAQFARLGPWTRARNAYLHCPTCAPNNTICRPICTKSHAISW